jgi:NAD(P)-dependent dehydrogenase (short-subunit alcohol dehydrogenase family)
LLAGKIILITGGTAGLGRQSVLELARHNPEQIWLAARNLTKANETITEIKNIIQNPSVKITPVELDLGSLISVRNAANQVLQSSSRLDILLNNAGIMAHPAALTNDGYEIQFGTNFLGHALLIRLLLPLLLKTASNNNDTRIISLTSGSHARAPSEGIRFDTLRSTGETMSALERYGQSKLANILYAKKLASRHGELKVVSVSPGMVNTGLTSVMAKGSMFFRLVIAVVRPFQGVPVEDGVRNQLWAAVSPDVASGEFYSPIGVIGKGSMKTRDEELEKELWEWTEKEIDAFLTRI